jgi:putative endonuclease
MPFVYILKSKESGKYYIGSTTNLVQRLKHHQGGHTPSTKKLGEVQLVFKQKYDSLSEARKIEKRLKKLKRKDYIEKIIEKGIIKMKVEN